MSKNSSRPVGRHFLHIPGRRRAGPHPARDGYADHRPSRPGILQAREALLDGIKTIFKTANPVIIYTATHRRLGGRARQHALARRRVLMVETGQFALQWKTMATKLGLVPESFKTDWRIGAEIRSDRGKAARGQEQGDQGGLRAAQRNRDRACLSPIAEIRKRSTPPAIRRCSSSTPSRRSPRPDYRHDEWASTSPSAVPEGPDAAARHVVQRGERQGARRQPEAASPRSFFAGTTCST